LGFKIDYPHARRSYSDSGFGDDDDDQLELSKTSGELNDKKCDQGRIYLPGFWIGKSVKVSLFE